MVQVRDPEAWTGQMEAIQIAHGPSNAWTGVEYWSTHPRLVESMSRTGSKHCCTGLVQITSPLKSTGQSDTWDLASREERSDVDEMSSISLCQCNGKSAL